MKTLGLFICNLFHSNVVGRYTKIREAEGKMVDGSNLRMSHIL